MDEGMMESTGHLDTRRGRRGTEEERFTRGSRRRGVRRECCREKPMDEEKDQGGDERGSVKGNKGQ